jgi:hypothetical protein
MTRAILILAMLLAACGGEVTESTTEPADDGPDPTTATDQAAPPETQASADEPADEPAAEPDAIAITLTIGDETWDFPGAQCAFQNAPAGDAGSEWNVSYVTNGLQVYVADDAFGILVSVADIENGGNPTVSWEAINETVDITVDGDDISASGTFTDGVNGGTAEGTLTAKCPDWYDATP